MPKSKFLSVAMVLVAMVLVASFAHAQGTLFVNNNRVGIGVAAPTELLHLLLTPAGPELKMRLEQKASNAWAYSVVDNNPARPDAFRISKQGSGGAEVDIIGRLDPGGVATMEVSGSIKATNVVFTSSREKKTGFEAVDPSEVLDKVSQLEMSTWEYKEGSPGRHIGPIAEDFQEAFALGSDGKTISVVDANGIALAAIQGLHAEVQERDQAIEALAAQVRELQSQLDSLAKR